MLLNWKAYGIIAVINDGLNVLLVLECMTAYNYKEYNICSTQKIKENSIYYHEYDNQFLNTL